VKPLYNKQGGWVLKAISLTRVKGGVTSLITLGRVGGELLKVFMLILIEKHV
jgi:hypothetical protein